MTKYEDIQFDVTEGIAQVTLHRPEVHNAFTQETIFELNEALREAATDTGIVAVILTGSEGRFCSGADLTTMPDWSVASEAEYGNFLWTVQNVVRRLRKMPKPTIAAVEGAAVGAGCDFALACDIRVLTPDAILKESFVRAGLVPGDGGAWLLPRLIGRARAMEYLLIGKEIPAEKAEEIGIANRISEEPLETSRELAEEFRELPRLAVGRTKELSLIRSFEEYCERAIKYQNECIRDPEHAEAVAALREGRSPNFDREHTDGS